MLTVIIVLLLLVLFVYIFINGPAFGQRPSGDRLKRIQRSPHYINGQFHNLSLTPALTEGADYIKVMKEFFLKKNRRKFPSSNLPAKKTDLVKLNAEEDVLIWFGHSSYFIQLDGKKILVDPVLSGHASPVKFTTRSFRGSDVYEINEIPRIDYLFITHDHWDHLDHKTLIGIKPLIRQVITGLGVGAHLERWGYDPAIISEMDWNEKLIPDPDFEVINIPARHFSGRSLKRNETLWSSFVLKTPHFKIFIGGDSGYDEHFKNAGERFGPFDLAILENGQYNKYWKYIHMMPEEVVQAAIDLNANKFLPVHWSKFSLSMHDWDEPIIRVVAEAEKKGVDIVHPMIGEVLYLNEHKESKKWWEGVDVKQVL
jgi:L-ascorbate metabolism protein UlaG (beta-lactamase superfamily)